MRDRSKSTLFLIEQLIVIAVFAICAAACIRILTNAFFYSKDSRDISIALLAAESGAESFKAVTGDLERIAELIGGDVYIIDGGDTVLIVYYDLKWQPSCEDEAFYVMRMANVRDEAAPPRLLTGEVTVERVTGEELVSIPVAVVV
jgi:hypothetical protein